jgi:DNA-binding SARP family transcriptional activator
MSELKLLLLGTPVILWHERSFIIRRRILRSILYFLAIRGDPVGRGELINLLWSDLADNKARSYLRDHLSKLRAALPDKTMLLTDAENVTLDFQRTSVDVHDYMHLIYQIIDAARHIPDDHPLTEELYTNCMRANALWRSPQLLAGSMLHDSLEYEEWLTYEEKRKWRSRVLLLERMVHHCGLLKDHGGRLRWLYDLALLDPYNDDYHIEVMHTLVDFNNPREAYSYGQKIRIKYELEMGLPPSTAFLDLLEKLQSGMTQ